MIIFIRKPLRSVSYGLTLRKGADGIRIIKRTDLVPLDMDDLVWLFNQFANSDVKRFADHQTAVDRAWEVMVPSFNKEKLTMSAGTATPKAAKAAAPKAGKVAGEIKPKVAKVAKEKAPAGPRLITIPAKNEARAVRAGTRIARTIDQLAAGTTLKALCADLSKDGTGTPAYVRSWLRFDVNTRVGYGVKSVVAGDDLNLKLVLPEGLRKPFAHTVAEVKAPKAAKAVKSAKAAKAAEA